MTPNHFKKVKKVVDGKEKIVKVLCPGSRTKPSGFKPGSV